MTVLRSFETSIILWTASTYEKARSGKAESLKEEDSQAAEYHPHPTPQPRKK
jgi:hypothetical protein